MGWIRRVRNVLRPERLSRELDRELSAHIAESADALMAAGMPESDAYREARRRFGNPARQKERTRDVDVAGWLESVVGDIRYGFRALVSEPVFAIVAVLSLGLGIGANTAIFSLINAVVLRPLPVHAPEELVQLTMGGGSDVFFTNPIWEAFRDRNEVFVSAFAYHGRPFNLAGGGEVRQASGYLVSGEFFATLGVRPLLGRLLTPTDDVRGCPAIAVVSAAFWERELGSRAELDQATVRLDGHRFQVVGVVEPGFSGVDVGQTVQVYAPLCTKDILDGAYSLDRRTSWFLKIIGRSPGNVELAQVGAMVAALSPSIFAATIPPDFDADRQRRYATHTLAVDPVAHGVSALRAQYGGALLALMGVVAVVLLIACANVAHLLLARATARRHEMAIRLAIGAGRARVVRQLLTESLMLAVAGGAIGTLLARWGSNVLVRLLDQDGRTTSLDLSLDWRVLTFTIAAATITGLLFGLAPAWQATRVAPQTAMTSGGRTIIAGHSRFGAGKALVIGQVALSFSLLVAAGLLLGTFRNLVAIDPGFETDGILLVQADLHGTDMQSEGFAATRGSVLERLRTLPGVRSASASDLTPISGSGWNGQIDVEGYTPVDRRDALVFFNAVSNDFFKTFGTKLVAGREPLASDGPGTPRVAVINEAMARKFFGTASPLGREFLEKHPDGTGQVHTVVGVVENAKYFSLREEAPPTVYLPMSQHVQGRWVNFALRTDGDPTDLRTAVAREIAAVHPAITLELRPFANQVQSSLARERLLATLAGFFGALAVILSLIGLYGTMSYAVERRRTEIGVRMALGASRREVVRMVLGSAGWLVALGLGVGLVMIWIGTRWIEGFLFGVAPMDPRTIVLAALSLVTVAVAAASLPAWRGARVDPMRVLRES